MAAHPTSAGDSSRKPSGSSTRSGNHSPSDSPTNAQTQRKAAPGPTGNMFTIGAGLKGLNAGWQVWGSANSSPKRNTSISSAAGPNDFSASQADTNYRASLGEGWPVSVPASGLRDDANGSPQRNEFSHLDSHSSMNLHHVMQRQATTTFPGARIDERSNGVLTGRSSPQWLDSRPPVKDSGGTRYPVAVHPPAYGTLSFSNQQVVNQPGGHDANSSNVENDLALTLRGSAVEDDYSTSQQGSQARQQIVAYNGPPQNGSQVARVPPAMRTPHSGYGADYAYYSNAATGDQYYGYDAYRGPADGSIYVLAGNIATPSQTNFYNGVPPQQLYTPQQSCVYYDHTGSPLPPGTYCYYPSPQTTMHSATHFPSQVPGPATLLDRKHEMQYNFQQQFIPPQGPMHSLMRPPSSPNPHGYFAALDYGYQHAFLLPSAGMYGISPQAMQLYQHNLRNDRLLQNHEFSVPLRSALLEEFRAKTRHWELRDILGNFVEFSGDQHGSRFIQQKLQTATGEEKQMVFDEIVPDSVLQLIQDVYGNYVIQKMFEHGTQVQKSVLANTMEGHILTLSTQLYGCRVVQKAVEYILPEQQNSFVRELEPHVLSCVKDANGNHVIQKLIERLSPGRLPFIHCFRDNLFDLATHPYGCRVLQRCFVQLPEEHSRPLLEELHKYSINLMQNQFGNYVIQFILEHGAPRDRALVVSKLRGHMLRMSRHKFASNVCEKILVTADSESRRILIEELMTPKQDGVSPILTMMKDQFANYVLQRALSVAEGQQKEDLINNVKPQLAYMRRFSGAYSKHLILIERYIADNSRAHRPPISASVVQD